MEPFHSQSHQIIEPTHSIPKYHPENLSTYSGIDTFLSVRAISLFFYIMLHWSKVKAIWLY